MANSFMYDPLDKAVEKLWFNNVVVVVAAGNYDKLNPPNPNKALNAFIVTDPVGGGPVFDATGWADKAKSDASWSDASWSAANASWSDTSWASASWADTATAAASWADLSLASASWADNAGDEQAAPDAGAVNPLELAAILAGTLNP